MGSLLRGRNSETMGIADIVCDGELRLAVVPIHNFRSSVAQSQEAHLERVNVTSARARHHDRRVKSCTVAYKIRPNNSTQPPTVNGVSSFRDGS